MKLKELLMVESENKNSVRQKIITALSDAGFKKSDFNIRLTAQEDDETTLAARVGLKGENIEKVFGASLIDSKFLNKQLDRMVVSFKNDLKADELQRNLSRN